MKKMLMYDECNETYTEVIDVKELKEYILKRTEEIERQEKEEPDAFLCKRVLQSFLEDLEVEDD